MLVPLVYHRFGIGLLALGLLCFVGCGEGAGDADSGAGASGTGSLQQTQPGEIVVEPSKATMVIDGEETPAVEVVKQLVAEGVVDVPIGYLLTLDGAFDEPGRVRLVVAGEPGIEAVTPESTRRSAETVYESLASAFVARAESAKRAELAALRKAAADANEDMLAAQARLKDYQASRSGLPTTSDSRQRRMRLDQLFDRTLDRVGELDEAAQLMNREISREVWATLTRIR